MRRRVVNRVDPNHRDRKATATAPGVSQGFIGPHDVPVERLVFKHSNRFWIWQCKLFLSTMPFIAVLAAVLQPKWFNTPVYWGILGFLTLLFLVHSLVPSFRRRKAKVILNTAEQALTIEGCPRVRLGMATLCVRSVTVPFRDVYAVEAPHFLFRQNRDERFDSFDLVTARGTYEISTHIEGFQRLKAMLVFMASRSPDPGFAQQSFSAIRRYRLAPVFMVLFLILLAGVLGPSLLSLLLSLLPAPGHTP